MIWGIIGILFGAVLIKTITIDELVALKNGEDTEESRKYKWTPKRRIFNAVGGLIIGGLFLVGGIATTFDGLGSTGHKCAICGKTTGLRQITNTHGDHYWYCAEHYADAWQYYYGK